MKFFSLKESYGIRLRPRYPPERVGIEQPAIDLYDLSKKIQYVTRKELEIANDLLKDLPQTGRRK